MRWFGPSWNAPVCEEGEQVETPTHKCCEVCEKRIEEDAQGLVLGRYHRRAPVGYWTDFPVHLDCLLEMVT